MNTKMHMLLAMSCLLLQACHDSGAELEEEIPRLEVTTPLRRDATLTKEYVSQIHAFQHIELRALEKGYLQETLIDEGQMVEQGTPMFKIMPNVYQAEYEKARAEANVARIEYENTRGLAEKKTSCRPMNWHWPRRISIAPRPKSISRRPTLASRRWRRRSAE